jgi:hypothetical protein
MCEPKFHLLQIKFKVNVHCYADSYATRRSANNILSIRTSIQDEFCQISRWEEQEILSGLAAKSTESLPLIFFPSSALSALVTH